MTNVVPVVLSRTAHHSPSAFVTQNYYYPPGTNYQKLAHPCAWSATRKMTAHC